MDSKRETHEEVSRISQSANFEFLGDKVKELLVKIEAKGGTITEDDLLLLKQKRLTVKQLASLYDISDPEEQLAELKRIAKPKDAESEATDPTAPLLRETSERGEMEEGGTGEIRDPESGIRRLSSASGQFVQEGEYRRALHPPAPANRKRKRVPVKPGRSLKILMGKHALYWLITLCLVSIFVGYILGLIGTSEAKWAVPSGLALLIGVAVVLAVQDKLVRRSFTVISTGVSMYRTMAACKEEDELILKQWEKPKEEWALIMSPEYREDMPKEQQERSQQRWDVAHKEVALMLRDVALSYKGLWIKLCQFIASRGDSMNRMYALHLKMFEDSQPPRPFEETLATLKHELGDGVLCDLEEQPLSVASIGSVYKAKLEETGEEVVVKVLHKDIVETLLLDCDVILMLLHVLAWLKPQWDFRPIMLEWLNEAPQETDFRIEAENMKECRRMLKSVSTLPDPYGFRFDMPKIMWPYVKRRVLVLGFVRANRMRSYIKTASPDELKRLNLDIVRCMSSQIFIDGFFNADPHPGNFLVHDDGTPVLLDFGLTKSLPANYRTNLAETMVYADQGNKIPELTEAFAGLGLVLRDKALNEWLPLVVLMHWDCRKSTTKMEDFRKEFVRSKSKKDRKNQHDAQKKVMEEGLFESFPENYVLYQRSTSLLRNLSGLLGYQGSMLPLVLPFARATMWGLHPCEQKCHNMEMKEQTKAKVRATLGDVLAQTKTLLLAIMNDNDDDRILLMTKRFANAKDAVSATVTDISLEKISVEITSNTGAKRTVFINVPKNVDGGPEEWMQTVQEQIKSIWSDTGLPMKTEKEWKLEYTEKMMRNGFKHPKESQVLIAAISRMQAERKAAAEAAAAQKPAAEAAVSSTEPIAAPAELSAPSMSGPQLD